jgi:hypothetical protein
MNGIRLLHQNLFENETIPVKLLEALLASFKIVGFRSGILQKRSISGMVDPYFTLKRKS